MTHDTKHSTSLRNLTPSLAQKFVRERGAQLIDVRTSEEYGIVHIPGAVNIPLDTLPEQRHRIAELEDPLILVCRSGARARSAHGTLTAHGMRNIHILDGGLIAWEAASLPVRRTSTKWDLERQVRFVAGLIVALSVTAGYLVHASLFAIAGAVGAGLVVAAATNSCILGMALLRLPYNRSATACTTGECAVSTAER